MNVKRQYPWGAHKPHVVENLLAGVVVTLNDLIETVDVRRRPRLSLPRYRQRKHVVLTITLPDKQRKRVPLTLGHNTLVIGDDRFVCVDGEDGVMNLVRALVGEIESFWASNGAT